MSIDYQRMQKRFPVQKAALTRALKQADPENRKQAVLATCAATVAEWNEIGAWPDDWARWQRALDDVFPFFSAPQLDQLA